MTESYTAWKGVDGIVAPAHDIVLHADAPSALVLLQFADGTHDGQDVLVRFTGGIVAATYYEEFSHPSMVEPERGPRPLLDPDSKWAWYYPMMEVHHSTWIASVPMLDHWRDSARHFAFVSGGFCVDVIARGDVTAEWVPRGSVHWPVS